MDGWMPRGSRGMEIGLLGTTCVALSLAAARAASSVPARLRHTSSPEPQLPASTEQQEGCGARLGGEGGWGEGCICPLAGLYHREETPLCA